MEDDGQVPIPRPLSAMYQRPPTDQAVEMAAPGSNGLGVTPKPRSSSMNDVKPSRDELFGTAASNLDVLPQNGNLNERDDALRALLTELHVREVEVQRTGDKPVEAGSFGDVWTGSLLPSMEPVAIKIPRNGSNIVKLCKSLKREIGAWSSLQHRHVLSLLGVASSPNKRELWLISPWMRNKNLREYLQDHPDADALHMLMGVGRGLSYVHSRRIVHGDLKANNILVDDDGEPQLMDFGLSYDLEIPALQTTSSMFQGNVRWLAPERLYPESFGLSAADSRSTAGDMYALGMVIYEVFSGQVPFYETSNTVGLIQVVLAGRRPAYPSNMTRPGLTARLWSFVGSCWHQDRRMRPISDTLEPFLLDAESEVGDYRRMALRAQKAEAALKDVTRQLSNALRDNSEEAERARKQLVSLAEREATQRQELFEAKASLKRTRAALESKSQELQAFRVAVPNMKAEEASQLASDPSFDRPADYYMETLGNLNALISSFSDQFKSSAGISGTLVKGTICSVLFYTVLEARYFGMDETQEMFIRQAEKRINDIHARNRWTLLAKRLIKTGQRMETSHFKSAQDHVVEDILHRLAKELAPSNKDLRLLLDDILQLCAALSQDLACDSTTYRVTYFGTKASFNTTRMTLASGRKGQLSTLQFGFETKPDTVHLKAVVAYY
ncbi:kinase-like protein [Calocera viscosa TUFC12733]|uniref:Kinase-like protein n=1 Tax=Calocera viscosa (strain TUFC12733) TaxID=1330018 RepID=A0A167P4J9_CALVF|nr:kinase-like protein [Calocera viscosa TUFC12733]